MLGHGKYQEAILHYESLLEAVPIPEAHARKVE